MTKAVDVIITLDYETFDTDEFLLRPDLSIDWDRDILAPTDELASFLESHEAKLTVLWDTAEYFWLIDNGMETVARAIEAQLIDLVKRGHDVQLHLHPAWETVRYDGERYIWTDLNRRIPTMGREAFEVLLQRSVETMKSLFSPIRPDYAVLGFRGRSYDIEPFQTISDTLVAHGIRADSSKHGVGPYGVQLPKLDIEAQAGKADFLEYPIYKIGPRRWDYSGAVNNVMTPLDTLDFADSAKETLVMTGHCKQKIHWELFQDCLSGLREKLGDRLRYRRWQDAIEDDLENLQISSRLAGKYGKRYFDAKWKAKDDPFGGTAVYDPYYQTLLDLLPDSFESILDLGCGEGAFTALAAKKGGVETAMGVDISPTAMEKAASSHPGVHFVADSMLGFKKQTPFSVIVSSQNLLYFTPQERAVIYDHVESMLDTDGLFLAAWWLDGEYGNEEQLIEEELRRHFNVVQAINYDGGWENNTIKGNHRIMLLSSRLDKSEENLLKRIYWEDKQVLCESSRNDNLEQRFSTRAAGWNDASRDEYDLIICDAPQKELLDKLRLNGSLVLYDSGVPEGFLFIEGCDGLCLGARLE